MLLSPKVIFFLSFGHHKGHFVILADPKCSPPNFMGGRYRDKKLRIIQECYLWLKDMRDLNGNNN